MSVCNEISCPKKRPRDSPDSVSEPSLNEVAHPPKRVRIAQEDRYTGHWPPRFWDSLSKVHLTRGALREFERRTSQKRTDSRPSLSGTYLSFTTSTESRGRQLKRFSGHSRPDLSHIRGVSLQSPYDSSFSDDKTVRFHPSPQQRHEPQLELRQEAFLGIKDVKVPRQ